MGICRSRKLMVQKKFLIHVLEHWSEVYAIVTYSKNIQAGISKKVKSLQPEFQKGLPLMEMIPKIWIPGYK